MNFKQRILNQKPFFLLMVLGAILWISSAASLSPIVGIQNQTTSLPTMTEDATNVSASATPEPVALEETPTLSPTQTPFPDWAMTSKDTNGLLFAGILILLIITIGTLAAVAKNAPEVNHKKNR